MQVHLATSKDDKKKGSAPAPTAAASTTCFWVLFALGWILAPCWFVAVALGLRKGHDHECLITRKKGMSDASKWAWRGSLAMSILSILAVILVPAIVYGISAGPAQQGACASCSPAHRGLLLVSHRADMLVDSCMTRDACSTQSFHDLQ